MRFSFLRLIQALVFLLTVSFINFVQADDHAGVSKEVTERIQVQLSKIAPNAKVEVIKPGPVKGLIQVNMMGGDRLFFTADASSFIAGDLYSFQAERLVNVSQIERDAVVASRLADIEDSKQIIFSPEAGPVKASITVFTDVDCGYCRKLHQQMAGYLEKGIEIKYLAFPRAGVGSPSYDKVVSAWCANDKQTAMTELKAGKSIAEATCENPVAAQYQLGQEIGVTGTPALVLESGRLVPGYIEPDRLAAMLGI